MRLRARFGEEFTVSGLRFHRLMAGVLFCLPASGGILITRTEQGFQFSEAASLLLNGKDKVSVLGAQPAATGPLSKLPSARISGVLLKDRDSGVAGEYSAGKLEYLLPQGLPKGSAEAPAAIWQSAKITSKQSPSDKVGTDVAPASFVALLPGGMEELVHLCTDVPALGFLGGKGKSSATQVELMSAVVRKYPNDPALTPLQKNLEDAMRSRYLAFENGTAGLVAHQRRPIPAQRHALSMFELILVREVTWLRPARGFGYSSGRAQGERRSASA